MILFGTGLGKLLFAFIPLSADQMIAVEPNNFYL